MNKDRYDYVCMEAEAGRDAFVSHPASREEGIVTQCVTDTRHLVVKTPTGERRCWDFHECEELRHKKSGPML
jgi:hypothetical protein